MKKLIIIPMLFAAFISFSQVGIGTANPNISSSLDLGPSAKPVILPRLTTQQMNEVTSTTIGMTVYNSTENQIYMYVHTSSVNFGGFNIPVYKWLPVSTGPRMISWGVMDSFAVEITGNSLHSINWDATNNWYKLGLAHPHEYYKDSMLLIVNPVGNGSWDQAVSTGEIIEGESRYATIKFTDVSRIAAGYSTLNSRRRSGFHFVLYDLRKKIY